MTKNIIKCAVLFVVALVAVYAFGGSGVLALPLMGMAMLGPGMAWSGRQVNEYTDQNGPGVSLRRPSFWSGGNLISPSSVANLPLRKLDGMPIDEYLATVKSRIIDAVDYRHFDTRIIIAATNVVAGTYNFFAVQQNQPEASLDGGTTFARKTAEYTNAIAAGTIEGANTLIVDSVQFSIFIPHRDYNAFTTATGLPSTGAPSATDTNSATNSLGALHQGSYFQFSEPNYPIFAEGKVLDFPSDRSIGGALGGATAEGWTQIGWGRPKYLRYVRVMQPLHNFTCALQFFRTITFPMNMILELALCGVKLLG